METKRDNIGALWKKEKDGVIYYKGIINNQEVIATPKVDKQGKQPDLLIYNFFSKKFPQENN